MPAWIHDRVTHLKAKNPSMPESEAWAIATQQSHALGKTPKSYGTLEGREKAKEKYKTPGDDEHRANPKEKRALLERLVRLGATDVPNTPRLLMRQRSPQELAALQQGVSSAFGKLQAPVEGAIHRTADKVFTPRVAGALKSVASLGVKNPEIIPMQAVPVPGLTPAYLAGKRGLESLIDKVAPLPKTAAGASTRGGFLMASDIPSFSAPDLKNPIQKRSGFDGKDQPNEGQQKMSESYGRLSGLDEPNQPVDKVGDFDPKKKSKKSALDAVLIKDGDMLPDYVTYSPGDFKRSKYALSLEDMSKFVEELRKGAAAGGIMGVSPSLGGASQAAKAVGAPKLSGPGPSIMQQVKPKGPHFGSGIAGAFKGSIGGRTPQKLE